MAIEVTCPGCKKRFRVSDQFAGKKGPCPDCKTVIQIPEKGPEVVIHAPETSGPKDAQGRPVLKPLRRRETKLTPVLIGALVGGPIAALLGALVVRAMFERNPGTLILAIGALILAPPLVVGGYSFLRDQELEPHRGRAILLRGAICSIVYTLLWGFYVYLPPLAGLQTLELPHLAVLIPLMVGIGALAGFATLDLDFGSAAMHYGLYLIVTFLLCMVSLGRIPSPAFETPTRRPIPQRTQGTTLWESPHAERHPGSA